MAKSTTIAVREDKEVRDQLAHMAKLEGTTPSAIVRRLIRNFVNKGKQQ